LFNLNKIIWFSSAVNREFNFKYWWIKKEWYTLDVKTKIYHDVRFTLLDKILTLN
jgi:hypothetical protein